MSKKVKAVLFILVIVFVGIYLVNKFEIFKNVTQPSGSK